MAFSSRMFALGVSMYGQMTAGSYCYIGPQGIVHGTTLTVLNAGRKYLGLDSLAGKVFLTSGNYVLILFIQKLHFLHDL
jgi:urocanate hydratase